MTSSTPFQVDADITVVPGVGPRLAAVLGRMEITTVGGLLDHIPMRYEHEHAESTIAEVDAALPDDEGAAANVSVRGEIAAIKIPPGRRPRIEVTLEDETGTVQLVWFNAPWLRNKLRPGLRLVAEGRAKRWRGYLQIGNPQWREEDDVETPARDARLRPVYPASEDLPSRRIEEFVTKVLEPATKTLIDPLPDEIRKSRALKRLGDAYRDIHQPESPRDAADARRRLAFDELLLLQLGVMMKRRHLRETMKAAPLALTPEIEKRILGRFPFELTPDQRQVCREIGADLARDVPTNRLLQGDVGAGKTAVAVHAMLLAAAHGHQSAIMAPTGILAEQHHASISRMLEGAEVEVGLLTGSTPAKEKRVLLERIAAGDVKLLIGTHALLSEGTVFDDLALVIIDEQHRFGVEQRSKLRRPNAEGRVPHVLVMTATPIPRTLSLTVFGDLDVSVIRHLPPGRTPTVTRVVAPSKAPDVYGYLAERVAAGEQGFVVVPAVEESDMGLADVENHLKMLAAGPLSGVRLGAIHGRMSRDEREGVMDRFRARDIDVLVATVVIEVGVDVPNATVMVVEHAERFGLAQLHQLRGRVGRGEKRGVCALIGEPTTEEGRRRLEAIGGTEDGFEIAELDLGIRGPGELFGARQSGLPPFRVADLLNDLDLLRLARQDAADWIERDPRLLGPDAVHMRRRLMARYGATLGLGDVG